MASHYKRDRHDFEQTAKYWTEVYANGRAEALPEGVTEDSVARIVDMGFDRSKAIRYYE